MTPEELIEAAPVGARHRREKWCSSWLAHFVHEPWASRFEPLYSQATVQSLISERDAALARVAELEADAEIGRLVRLKLTSGNAIGVERCTVMASELPNVRDAGPTPYSGRTTRREG